MRKSCIQALHVHLGRYLVDTNVFCIKVRRLVVDGLHLSNSGQKEKLNVMKTFPTNITHVHSQPSFHKKEPHSGYT